MRSATFFAQISNWRTNKNEAHIKSATPQIEAALVSFAQIPCAVSSNAPQSEVQSLRRSVAQHIVQAEKEVASLDQKLAESMSQIEAQLTATSNKVGDTEASISRLKEDADSALEAARAQVGSQQQTFLEAQELRSSSFSDLLESSKLLVGTQHEQLLHDVQESLAGAQSEAQATLGKIEESQEKAQQILGIIDEEALVGTYSKLATEEKETANFLRWVAIGLTIGTVALGVWMVVQSGSPGSDWDLFASRAVLTIPIAAAAAYAGRQSSEHRAAQRRSEDMALQLGSLGPFLSDLDKPSRDKVRMSPLAWWGFGRGSTVR